MGAGARPLPPVPPVRLAHVPRRQTARASSAAAAGTIILNFAYVRPSAHRLMHAARAAHAPLGRGAVVRPVEAQGLAQYTGNSRIIVRPPRKDSTGVAGVVCSADQRSDRDAQEARRDRQEGRRARCPHFLREATGGGLPGAPAVSGSTHSRCRCHASAACGSGSPPRLRGRMLSATVGREADRSHVSWTVEVERDDPRPVERPVVGTDLGPQSPAVLSGERGRMPSGLRPSSHATGAARAAGNG